MNDEIINFKQRFNIEVEKARVRKKIYCNSDSSQSMIKSSIVYNIAIFTKLYFYQRFPTAKRAQHRTFLHINDFGYNHFYSAIVLYWKYSLLSGCRGKKTKLNLEGRNDIAIAWKKVEGDLNPRDLKFNPKLHMQRNTMPSFSSFSSKIDKKSFSFF